MEGGGFGRVGELLYHLHLKIVNTKINKGDS